MRHDAQYKTEVNENVLDANKATYPIQYKG